MGKMLLIKFLKSSPFFRRFHSILGSQVEFYMVRIEYDLASSIRCAFNKFPEFFVLAFKIDVDSWKYRMILLYILWDD